jgi:chlorobactene glucosyltransferase
MRTSAIDDVALAVQFKRAGLRIELVDARGLLNNQQWTSWRTARQGWVKSCYSEVFRAQIPLSGLPASLALLAYGLWPLSVVLSAPWMFRRHPVATSMAALTLLAQIDAKRQFDREFRLPWYWNLLAPLSWAACGLMGLDVNRLIITRRTATWKGRHLPPQTSPDLPLLTVNDLNSPGNDHLRLQTRGISLGKSELTGDEVI